SCEAFGISDRCLAGSFPICTIPPMGVYGQLSNASKHLNISTPRIKALLFCDRLNKDLSCFWLIGGCRAMDKEYCGRRHKQLLHHFTCRAFYHFTYRRYSLCTSSDIVNCSRHRNSNLC